MGKEEDKEECRDEAEELVGNKSLCRFIKWSFSHCRLKASGSAYGRGGAEKREKAKQSGALSPQSGDEALEMDILNLFQAGSFHGIKETMIELYMDILISHLYGSKS